MKFEKDLSLVYFLSTSITIKSVWYLDSGAYHQMTKAWDLFNCLAEKKSGIHVELGYDSKYAVKGEGTIMF